MSIQLTNNRTYWKAIIPDRVTLYRKCIQKVNSRPVKAGKGMGIGIVKMGLLCNGTTSNMCWLARLLLRPNVEHISLRATEQATAGVVEYCSYPEIWLSMNRSTPSIDSFSQVPASACRVYAVRKMIHAGFEYQRITGLQASTCSCHGTVGLTSLKSHQCGVSQQRRFRPRCTLLKNAEASTIGALGKRM